MISKLGGNVDLKEPAADVSTTANPAVDNVELNRLRA
jgi:hypothetical protein